MESSALKEASQSWMNWDCWSPPSHNLLVMTRRKFWGSGMAVHAYNPSYSEGRGRKIIVRVPGQAKVRDLT
jgi:hypothetical protein